MKIKDFKKIIEDLDDEMEMFIMGEHEGGNKFRCVAYEPFPLIERYIKMPDNKKFIVARPCKNTSIESGAKKCLVM